MIEFHKIWIEQCEAARDIREAFGLQKAIGYLIGEKLLDFLRAADQDPACRPGTPAGWGPCHRDALLTSETVSPPVAPSSEGPCAARRRSAFASCPAVACADSALVEARWHLCSDRHGCGAYWQGAS